MTRPVDLGSCGMILLSTTSNDCWKTLSEDFICNINWKDIESIGMWGNGNISNGYRTIGRKYNHDAGRMESNNNRSTWSGTRVQKWKVTTMEMNSEDNAAKYIPVLQHCGMIWLQPVNNPSVPTELTKEWSNKNGNLQRQNRPANKELRLNSVKQEL